MSVIPCEVALILPNPLAFVLYGNRDNIVVLLLLKIVLVEQVAGSTLALLGPEFKT